MEKGYSIYEAFAALDEIEDEVDSFPTKKNNSRMIQEGKGFDLRNYDDVDKAAEFREKDKNTQDVTLEVIDADADALENMKSPEEYIGKMLLQCNTCKATTFVSFDDLEKSETDEDTYNMEMECPHCHGKGAGYLLIGQVGKSEEEPKVDNDEKEDEKAEFDNDLESEAEDQEGTDIIHNDDTEDKEGDSESFKWEDDGSDPLMDTDTSEDEDENTEDESKDESKDEEDESEEEDEEEKKKKKAKKEALEEAINNTPTQLTQPYKYFSAQEVKDEMSDLVPEMTYNKIVDSGLVDDFGDIVIPEGTKVEKVKEDEDYNYYKFVDYDIVLPVDKLLENQPMINDSSEIKEELTNEDVDLSEWTGSVDAFIHHFITENDSLRVNFYTEDGLSIASFEGDEEDAQEIPFTILSASVVKFSFTSAQIDINLTKDEQEYTVAKLFDLYNIDEDSENINFSVYMDDEPKDEIVGVEKLINKFGDEYIQLPFSVNELNLFIEGENIEPEEQGELGEVTKLEEDLINRIISENKLLTSHKERPNTRENFIAESIRLKEDLDIVYKNFVAKLPPFLQKDFKQVTGYKDKLDEVLEEYGYNRNNIQPYMEKQDDSVVVEPEPKKEIVKESFKPGEGLYESVKSRAELENLLKKDIDLI